MYARYTEYLGDLMKNEYTKAALDKALSTYPLYVGKKEYDLIPTREELNKKLLNHYKYREIGFETIGRFLDELEITMCEIMPLYNERFKTIEIMSELEDPFGNVDMLEEHTETRQGSSSGSGSGTMSNTSTMSEETGTETDVENNTTNSGTNSQTSTSTSQTTNSGTNNQTVNGKKVESDTPQDSLNIGSKGINNVNYASNAEWDESIASGSNSSNGTETSNNQSNGENSTTGKETSKSTASGSIDRTVNDSSETSNQSSSESNESITYTTKRKGNHGANTYAHDMIEFRTSQIDVAYEIITDDRIAELFMLVY